MPSTLLLLSIIAALHQGNIHGPAINNSYRKQTFCTQLYHDLQPVSLNTMRSLLGTSAVPLGTTVTL